MYALRMQRRTFLKASALLATMSVAACSRPWWSEQAIASDASFPNGVLAGSPEEQAITLVVLVEHLVGPRSIAIELASDPLLADTVYRGVVAVPELDPHVPLKILLQDAGLQPGTRYYYRFITQNTQTAIASFRTLRRSDDETPCRLGFFSCQGYSAGYYTAHAHLAREEELDLVASLGDYIYELTDDVGPPLRPDQIGTISQYGNGLAQTLEEYRHKYTHYRSDENLRAMHAAHSFVAIWDNHELATGATGTLDGIRPTVPLAERMSHGRQAFFEQMPMFPGSRFPLSRQVRMGAHLELFLLDMWTYQDPGRGIYLGSQQMAWLMDGLRRSTATWKVIASTTVMMATDYPAGRPISLGQWDGFPEERKSLIQALIDAGLEDVIVISGDLHTFLAGQVTTTGRMDGQTGALEFSGGAISSFGLFNLLPDERELANSFRAKALTENLHWSFADLLTRGYAVLEAQASALFVTFRGVHTTFEPSSAAFDVAKFRVAKGKKAIVRLPTESLP